ncbi:MAG: xanthine dehydrogenase family protein subunit M [Acidobacteria bacterium]|nr:xanthine dehydrogenase family protein subunit M [Acidobacteriota bacterium]
MLLTEIELHEAKTLQQASEWMARYAPDARLLAGGTDLLVDLKIGRVSVGHVVSLNRIAALRDVKGTEQGVRIGALVTPNQLASSPVIREQFPAILDATRDLAAPQIRNMATVGGNIASAVPSGDLPPILIVMNASVILWSPSGEREVPLDRFFVGPRQTLRRDEEILTEIHVPYPPHGFGAAYARFSLREANACAVATVAASLLLGENQIVREARICVGAVAPTPVLLQRERLLLPGKKVEEKTLQQAAEEAMEASHPISDIRGSAEYRRELVGILTRRAILNARQRALGGNHD